MNGNSVIQVKEFSLANLTANDGSYYSNETFIQWQKSNPRFKVVGIVPFQKTFYSQGNQQPTPSGSMVVIPMPTPIVESWFIVQYIEQDVEKQATQLETFLANEQN